MNHSVETASSFNYTGCRICRDGLRTELDTMELKEGKKEREEPASEPLIYLFGVIYSRVFDFLPSISDCDSKQVSRMSPGKSFSW
jgi:hypothetical protein